MIMESLLNEPQDNSDVEVSLFSAKIRCFCKDKSVEIKLPRVLKRTS